MTIRYAGLAGLLFAARLLLHFWDKYQPQFQQYMSAAEYAQTSASADALRILLALAPFPGD